MGLSCGGHRIRRSQAARLRMHCPRAAHGEVIVQSVNLDFLADAASSALHERHSPEDDTEDRNHVDHVHVRETSIVTPHHAVSRDEPYSAISASAN